MPRPAPRPLSGRIDALEDRVVPTTSVFQNTASIAIPDSGSATPYPSAISVSALTGTITNVTVTLVNYNHTFADDVAVLLRAPTGQTVELMRNAGGGAGGVDPTDVVNVTYTFADGAAGLSDTAPFSPSGTYRPSQNGAAVSYPASAPAGPYGTSLAALNGSSPNGTWNLFVFDDAPGDTGSFAGGWRLTLTTADVVGTAGNDTLVLRQFSGTQNEYSLNGAPFVRVSSAGPFTFVGGAGADLLYVDTSNGDPIPTGGVTFDGEVLRVEKVTGAATEAVTLTPSATPGSGTLTITGFGDITYTGVGGPGAGGIDLVNFTNATVRTGQVNDTLTLSSDFTIDNGGVVPAGYSLAGMPALLLGETVAAGVPGVGLRRVGSATLDTVAGGGAGSSGVTLNFTDAAGVAALTVAGGPFADTVVVTSTATPTSIQAGAGNDIITFDAGATLSGGTVDGGADADTLTYAAYTTPVAVNLGLGVAGLTAALDGGQEVPSNGTPAAGTATFTNYNAAARTFDLNLTVGGLAPAAVTGIHLHRGGLGANGPIVLDLLALGTLLPNGTGFTLALNGLDVDNFLLGGAANEAAFLGGQTYLNVHTAAFPGGAIRGQVFSTGNVSLTTGTATGTGGVSNVENATGGAAGDSLVGSFLANVLRGTGGNDTILGGPGADTFLGGANDDTLVWNNGDGSDVMDGEAGTDTIVVNGNLTADDVFTVAANGARIDFDRTSTGPFGLDIGTVETLRVAGVGGADTFTVGPLNSVANLQAVQLFGLAGTDTFEVTPTTVPVTVFGGGGTDTLNLGATAGPSDPFITPAADPAGGVTGSVMYSTLASVFFSQIEPPPDPFNYLTVTATDGLTRAAPGSAVTITVVVTNNSPLGLGGIGVSDLFPPELTGVTWTAAFTPDSFGATSGIGDINQQVGLRAGGSVTYTVTATLRTDVAGSFTNTATVTVPAGLVDANPADNTATDTTAISAALPPAPVVTGPGGGSGLRFSASGGQLVSPQAVAFFPGFFGEVHVAQGDVDDDGVFDIVAATGPGAGVFQVVRGSDGAAVTQIEPFPGYAGGLFVAVGDLTGDGKADIAVMPDAASAFAGPINRELPVRVYSGADFSLIAAFNGLADLQGNSGENEGTRLGGRPAIADVNGDGVPDLLVAAGNGGGPRVTIWSGAGFPGAAGGKPTVNPITNLFVFESSQRGGAFVTAGDVSGDGVADIIVGGGPGGGPRVRIVNGAQLFGLTNLDVNLDDPVNLSNGLVLNNFIAGDVNLRGGLRVAVADVDADGRADLVTGSGSGEQSSVRLYTGVALGAAFGTSSEPGVNQVLDPFGALVPGGVWVG